MVMTTRFWILLAVLSPAATEAQDATARNALARCRQLYVTWDAEVAAARAVGALEPGRGAERLAELDREAGACLLALQTDLAVFKDFGPAWVSQHQTAQSEKKAQSVQARALEMENNLASGDPPWSEPTFNGAAIGAAVNFRTPKEYLLDAGTVWQKWSDIAPRFAPVLEDLLAQLKPRAGLAVDLRACRALWLVDSPAEVEGPSTTVNVLSTVERIGYCLIALQNDLEVLDKHLRSLATQPKNVKASDISSWREPSLRGSAIGSVQSIEVDIDKYLIDAHLVHKPKNPKWREAETRVAPGLADTVHSVMTFRSMRQLISMLFTTEVVLLDMRRDGDSDVFVPEDAKAKTFPTATLLIESDHFLADSSRYAHFSFGGGLAALPVLNLLKRQLPEIAGTDGVAQPPPDNSMETNDKIYPTFQQAFVWDLNAKFHSQLTDRFEISAYGYLGQSVLLDDKSLVERDSDFVGVALANETGRAELFKGWLIEARAFDLDLKIIHGEHSYLNPRFSLAFGERWNDRFVPPTASPIPTDQWTKSRLFRFRWNIRNTLVSRNKYQGPLLVTFTFGVEREWWPDNSGLPTVTSVFFSGDFDLNKIIKKKE